MNRPYTVTLRNTETDQEIRFTEFFPDMKAATAWAKRMEQNLDHSTVEVREWKKIFG